MLQSELAKGGVYTHQQFKQKVENLAYNFEKLCLLNEAGDMKEFERHL